MRRAVLLGSLAAAQLQAGIVGSCPTARGPACEEEPCAAFLEDGWPRVLSYTKGNMSFYEEHARPTLVAAGEILQSEFRTYHEAPSAADFLRFLTTGRCSDCILLALYTWVLFFENNPGAGGALRMGLYLTEAIGRQCEHEVGLEQWIQDFYDRTGISPKIIEFLAYQRFLGESVEKTFAGRGTSVEELLAVEPLDVHALMDVQSLAPSKASQFRGFVASPHPACGTPEPVIIDLGCDRGQDAFFFSSLEFPTWAIDANPVAAQSFGINAYLKKEIERGRVSVSALAVVPEGRSMGSRPVCLKDWERSFVPSEQEIEAGFDWSECVKGVQHVEEATCKELVEQTALGPGSPPVLYLKVDIEGMDIDCVKSVGQITPHMRKPLYIHFESPTHHPEEIIRAALALAGAGYSHRIKISNQVPFCPRFQPMGCSSGPAPEFHEDLVFGPRWVPAHLIVRHARKYVRLAQGLWLGMLGVLDGA